MKEYGELEKQMKKALIDIERREKQLNTKEQEVKYFSFLKTKQKEFSSSIIDSTYAN